MSIPISRLPSTALLVAVWLALAGATPARAAPAARAPGSAAASAARAAAAPALLGPPAICHPIEIGDARSLPWDAAHAFGTRADYDIKDVVDDTRAVLRGTPDTLVHMETVRRAVIYLTGIGGEAHADGDEGLRAHEIARLVQVLKADIIDAQFAYEADAGGARALALTWFDAGYALCALEQAGRHVPGPDVDGAPGLVMLGKAAALLPHDGGVQLGASIAHFGEGRPDRACYAHLDKALQAADDPDGLLRLNVLHTMGSFLGATNHDELVAKVRTALERA